MATSLALVITPAPADEQRDDWSDTFQIMDAQKPVLSIGELSAQRGDGVFETVGVSDGHAQEVGPHLDRLAHSAQLVDLPAPNLEQWRAAVKIAEEYAGAGEWAIKLVLSRGVDFGPAPTAWLTVNPTPSFEDARTNGVQIATLDRGYAIDLPQSAPWLLLGAKTLSYAVNMAAIREAKRRGADDAVFLSSDGFVLEAPTATLVLRFTDENGVRFVTPAPNGSILHGTTQLSLWQYLETQGYRTEYARVTASDLAQADAAWLVSSVRLAAPIRAFDDHEVPVDAELTKAINEYLLSPRD